MANPVKRLLLFLFMLGPIVVPGKMNVDSLREVILVGSLPDSNRWDALEALFSYYALRQPDSALHYAEEYYSQAETSRDQDAMARALARKGAYFEIKSDHAQALDYYGQSLKIFEASGNQSGIADILNYIGINYSRQNDYSQAIDYFRRSQAIQEDQGNQLGVANSLNNIGYIYKNQGKYVQALEHFNRSIKIYEAQGDQLLWASTLVNIGNIHSDQGDYAQALDQYNQSLRIYESLDDLSNIAKILGNLGLVYFHQGDFIQAEDYTKQSQDIYEALSDQWGKMMALNNLALIYQNQGAYARALDHYQRALKIIETTGDQNARSVTLRNIGLVYHSLGNFTKAMEYYRLCLEVQEKLGNQVQIANALGSIATIYRDQRDLTQALDFFQRALKIHNSLGVQTRVAEVLLKIGDVYRTLDNYRQALDYCRRGLKIYEELGDQFGIVSGLNIVGNIYSDQRNFTQAKSYGEQALPIAREVGNLKALMDVAMLLHESYKNLKQPASALQMYELGIKMRDSLNSIENQQAIIRHEFEQQALKDSLAQVEKNLQTELAFQQQLSKKDQTRNALMALGLIALILALGLYLRNRFVQRTNVQLKAAKERVEQAEATKTRLYTNITHEFRTPLTVIRGMTDKIMEEPDNWVEKGGKLIMRNTDQLLHLVNQMLDLRKLESNSLQLNMVQGDMIAYLKYIVESFHSLAESKDLQLDFQSEIPSLLMDHDPQRVLQIVSNLLSNAIKFSPEGGMVCLKCVIDSQQTGEQNNAANYLLLMVADNGMGIPPEKLPHIFDRFYQADDSSTRSGEGTGVGLALTRELVKLLGGSISVESEMGKGTTFEVMLPVHNDAPMQTFQVSIQTLF